jgi:Ca2+/H+ antiporter
MDTAAAGINVFVLRMYVLMLYMSDETHRQIKWQNQQKN